VLQILDDEFDHDCVVEVTESGDAVGNQILTLREVDQAVRHPRAILPLHVPFFVFEHLHHALEFLEALHDEPRSVRAANFFDQLADSGDELRFVDSGTALAHLFDDALEILQVLVAEFEGDVHRHGLRSPFFAGLRGSRAPGARDLVGRFGARILDRTDVA